MYRKTQSLTVRLLVPGTGTGTTELLRLHAAGVGNEESTVAGKEGALEKVLGLLVNVLLVVGNKTLSEGLTDSVDLRYVTTTGDSDTDVEVLELLDANDKEGLVDLHTENLGLNESDGDTVNLDKAFALFNKGNCGSRLLLAKGLDTGNDFHLLGHGSLVSDIP